MKNLIWLTSVFFMLFFLSGCTNKKEKNNENKVVEIPDEHVIVEIPDANFKTYLLENFDANRDGEISLLEAKAVKVIDCSSRNIESLKGISDFTNLESLNCSKNQLKELNLVNNKKLSRLICTENNELLIIIGMSSPMIAKGYQKPAENQQPSLSQLHNPVDLSKCTYDQDKRVVIQVSLDY